MGSAKSLIAESNLEAEVVVLGDSTAMLGLDPHLLDEVRVCLQGTFNAAIPAANPVMINDWYRRAVEPTWAPELVVLGLTSITVTSGAVPDYFSSRVVREDWLGRVGRWAASVSALVEYRRVLRDPSILIAHYSLANYASWPSLDEQGWACRCLCIYVAQ